MSYSRKTGRYCLHPSEARHSGVDSMDVMYETCVDCGDVWSFGKVTPQRAAAVRRALAAHEQRKGGAA